jgi:ABC-type protease/lipase transport system fused ATPase/permease subunit
MNGDLHFGYNGGFFAWLVALCIFVFVAVWVGWLVLIGVAVIVVIAVVDEIRHRLRARKQGWP